MYYVYLLRSKTHPDQTYIGSTSDLRKRLAEHNSGKSIHTNKFKPRKLETYVVFDDHGAAKESSRSWRRMWERNEISTDGLR